jgi:hypothetical protein
VHFDWRSKKYTPVSRAPPRGQLCRGSTRALLRPLSARAVRCPRAPEAACLPEGLLSRCSGVLTAAPSHGIPAKAAYCGQGQGPGYRTTGPKAFRGLESLVCSRAPGEVSGLVDWKPSRPRCFGGWPILRYAPTNLTHKASHPRRDLSYPGIISQQLPRERSSDILKHGLALVGRTGQEFLCCELRIARYFVDGSTHSHHQSDRGMYT